MILSGPRHLRPQLSVEVGPKAFPGFLAVLVEFPILTAEVPGTIKPFLGVGLKLLLRPVMFATWPLKEGGVSAGRQPWNILSVLGQGAPKAVCDRLLRREEEERECGFDRHHQKTEDWDFSSDRNGGPAE